MVLAPWKRIYFWDLFSVPLASMSIFYASLTAAFDYHGFVVCSEIKKCETSALFFFFMIVFGYLGSFEVPYKFEDGLFYFCIKKYC